MADGTNSQPQQTLGSFSYDLDRGELRDAQGRPVHLRPQSVRVLEYLLSRAGQLVTRDELMSAVWPNVVVTDDSLVQCVRDIRLALGEEGSRLLRTVPRRGYRLDAAHLPDTPSAVAIAPLPVPAAAPAPVQTLVQEPLAAPAAEPQLVRRHWLRRPAALTVALAGVVGAGLAVYAKWRDGADAASALILPGALAIVCESCDPAPTSARAVADPLAAGEAMALADALTRSTDTPLIAVASGLALQARRGLSPLELARELRAGYVLSICAQVAGDTLLRKARLTDGQNGRALWSSETRSTVEQLARDDLTLMRHVSDSLRAPLRSNGDAPAMPPPPPPPPRSLAIYAQVAKAAAALWGFDRDEYRGARHELAALLQREPGYMRAWAVAGALNAVDAWAHVSGGSPPESAREALVQLERAIALDPAMALSHAARSLALITTGRRGDGLKAAERAVQLAPRDPLGSVALANALLANGRAKEALTVVDSLRPVIPFTTADFDFVHAKALWGAGRLDEAVSAATQCLERAPQFAACHGMRALASDSMGRLEASLLDLRLYREAVPGVPLQGPGSYPGKQAPRLLNDWLAPLRAELGVN